MTGATVDGTPPWRLRPRTRNRVLVIHVLPAGVWIGIDIVMAVLLAATRCLTSRVRNPPNAGLGRVAQVPISIPLSICARVRYRASGNAPNAGIARVG